MKSSSSSSTGRVIYAGPPQLNRLGPALSGRSTCIAVVDASSSLTFDAVVYLTGGVEVFGTLPVVATGPCKRKAGGTSSLMPQDVRGLYMDPRIGHRRAEDDAGVFPTRERGGAELNPSSSQASNTDDNFKTSVPQHLPPPHTGFARVSCGRAHILALSVDGRPFCWGVNNHGQLGVDVGVCDLSSPCEVPVPLSIGSAAATAKPNGAVGLSSMSAGGDHCLFVACDGTVWSWGKGTFGQLGIGPLAVAGVVTRPCGRFGSNISEGGGGESYDGVASLDAVAPQRVRLPPDVVVVAVAAGTEHSIFLDGAGAMYSCGWGLYHQLGHGTTSNIFTPRKITRVLQRQLATQDSNSTHGDPQPQCCPTFVHVACGTWHSAAMDQQGRLFSWGWGKFGQLGESATMLVPSEHGAGDASDSVEPAKAKRAAAPHMRPVPTQVALPPQPPLELEAGTLVAAPRQPNAAQWIRPLVQCACGLRYTIVCTLNHFLYFGAPLQRPRNLYQVTPPTVQTQKYEQPADTQNTTFDPGHHKPAAWIPITAHDRGNGVDKDDVTELLTCCAAGPSEFSIFVSVGDE